MATASAPEPGTPLSEENLSALREEHDRLARALVVRKSIDHVRRGSYASFLATVSLGLTVKFAWDRWGSGPRRAPLVSRFPLLFALALAVALAGAAVAVLAFLRARTLMRVEDRDFARLRSLQERLGIGP